MALIKRLLLVLLALTAVAGAAVGAVLWTLLKPPPGARQFKAAFPPEDWPALDALATPAEELERYDPTGVPPAPHPALAQLAGQIRDADPDEATMRKAAEGFLIGPQGFDTPTRLEVSAIHHAAARARAAGVTADDLARLSARAHGLRVTGQFSVPLLVVRAGQPVWRAVVSGRALQTPGPLDRDRRALRTAPVPPAAPLDPLYPLAALAVTSADGMGRALEEVGQRGYDRHRRLQTAFGLGQLYWWSLEPQQEEFFAMLAQDQGAGSPLDRLAALAGAVQGVNNLLMADDPDAAPLIPPFVQRWAQAIREPWVDAAAKEFWGEPYSHASFTLLAQCPEAPGYLEAMPGWAAAGEPGEEFLLLCYFSQISYATYLAAEYPEGLRRILARAPYPNDRLNAMLFQAYLEEMIRPRELAEELWPQAVPLGLRSLASESNYIPLAFALSLGRPWQEVWPAIQDRLAAVAQVGDPDRTLTLWPFAPNKPHQPICPLKRVRPGVAQPPVEDPLFFAAVDAELRRLWPTATPAFKLAVLKVHLPRAERAAQPLQPWLKYRAEIAPQLGRIEDQETLARLRAVFGR